MESGLPDYRAAIDDALQIAGFVKRLPATPQYIRARLAEFAGADGWAAR